MGASESPRSLSRRISGPLEPIQIVLDGVRVLIVRAYWGSYLHLIEDKLGYANIRRCFRGIALRRLRRYLVLTPAHVISTHHASTVARWRWRQVSNFDAAC